MRSEKSVPAPWLNDAKPQTVTLYANRDHTVYFENHKKPTLTVNKVDSVTGSPIKGAKFQVWYGSNNTNTGEMNDLGTFYSDENGLIRISGLKPGKSVVVTEVKAPAGFIIDTQAQTIQIKEGKTVTLTYKNQPKGKLIIQKRDSQTDEVLPGAEFRVTTAAGCEVGLDGVIGTSTMTQNGIVRPDRVLCKAV